MLIGPVFGDPWLTPTTLVALLIGICYGWFLRDLRSRPYRWNIERQLRRQRMYQARARRQAKKAKRK